LAPERQSLRQSLAYSNSVHLGGEEDIEYFDFTLPDEVTDYVISVHFDSSGSIDGITMES
jgi:hypothetical protein